MKERNVQPRDDIFHSHYTHNLRMQLFNRKCMENALIADWTSRKKLYKNS